MKRLENYNAVVRVPTNHFNLINKCCHPEFIEGRSDITIKIKWHASKKCCHPEFIEGRSDNTIKIK